MRGRAELLPGLCCAGLLRIGDAATLLRREAAAPQLVQLKRTHDFEHTYYYSEFEVGGYKQVTMMDSGSWELVLPASCDGLPAAAEGSSCCGKATCPSASYKLTSHRRDAERPDLGEIPYLGGSCTVLDGFDSVGLPGAEPLPDVPVRVIVDHSIHFFKTASAQAIFGISPGDPTGGPNKVLSAMGVERFTVCLDQSGEAGAIWLNDSPKASADKASWKEVRSTMRQYWGTWTSDWQLAGAGAAVPLGCIEDDCGVIIDTGTPLINLPQAMYDTMEKHIHGRGVADCSDLSKFPTLRFTIGDQALELSPEAYVADGGERQPGTSLLVAGLQFPAMPMSSEDHMLWKSGKPFRQCVLLFEHYGEDAQMWGYGPLVTLGLLSLRDYRVQFDLGARKMRFGEAAADCSQPQNRSRLERPTGARRLQAVVPHKLAPSLLARAGAKVLAAWAA